jgi:hypothetical protein
MKSLWEISIGELTFDIAIGLSVIVFITVVMINYYR